MRSRISAAAFRRAARRDHTPGATTTPKIIKVSPTPHQTSVGLPRCPTARPLTCGIVT